MTLKRDILLRIALIYFILIISAVIVFFKVIYLQYFEGDELRAKAREKNIKDIQIPSNRGNIFAYDGRLLASSVPYYEIRMDVNSSALSSSLFHKKVDSLAYCLSNLFRNKSQAEYKRMLVDAKKQGERFLLIKRKVSYQQLKKLKTFPLFRLGQYKGGLIAIQQNERVRPHGNLASRTIGYTTRSRYGNVVGIEGAFDKELKGITGVRLMQKLSGGIWMPISDKNEVEPKDGKDIVTTIDVNIQDVAESALLRQLLKHGAQYGTVVLMEVKTGDVKAIVNLQKDKNDRYREIYNFAVGASTEPGSTFKLASMLAVLEDGYVNLNDTIDTEHGLVKYYDHVLPDAHDGGYGKITVKEVFEKSSNVGVSKMIYEHYKNHPEKFIERLYRIGLNKKLGLEIKGEGQPLIRYPGDRLWSGITLPWMSIGYEVQMTPLQILTFYNAVANEGVMVKPKFVREIRFHGETLAKIKPEVLSPSICSDATLQKLKLMLEGVVQSGTAKNLKNENYKIAGKTGTAQIANDKYGYKQNTKVSYQASFVGYFPADDPKYSCIVVVNAPSKNVYYGNEVAGPVFKEISDKVYASSLDLQEDYLVEEVEEPVEMPYSKVGNRSDLVKIFNEFGIHYKDNHTPWVLTATQDSIVKFNRLVIDNRFVPNVKEMGLKDAIYLLEKAGLKVQVKGRGKVVSQSIKPGALAKKGDRIILEMSFI